MTTLLRSLPFCAIVTTIAAYGPIAAAQADHDHTHHAQPCADHALRARLNDAMIELEAQSQLLSFTSLPQIDSQHGPELSEPNETTISESNRFDQIAEATVMFHAAHKCGKCDNWHGGVTTGFIIHPDGWIITAAHIVDDLKDDKVCAVMLHDETVLPVTGVWKIDSDVDVAILKVDAENLPAIPLAKKNPNPGETVYVMSHPQGAFYYLTRGIVSRVLGSDETPSRRLQITAEFATGSSGAPVVNGHGNLIGVVLSTRTLYAKQKEEKHPQLILRSCAIVEDIRKMIENQ